jgi:cytochrome b
MTDRMNTTIRLWDLPTRLFHWATVLLLVGLWATHRFNRTDLHIKLGMAMLFLVVFRLAWGFLGSDTARFARFIKGPDAIRAYLTTGRAADGSPVIGHNPLGAFSVIGLIGLLAVQVGLGLFATDTDAVNSGPLNSWVTYDTAERLTHLHDLVFNLILALVVLHLAAIVFYTLVKKDRIVPSMVTGKKAYAEPVPQPRGAPLWRLALALVLAFAACDWVWNGGHLLPRPKPAYDISY